MQINADRINTETGIASLTHPLAKGRQGEMLPEHSLKPGPIGTIHRGAFFCPYLTKKAIETQDFKSLVWN